MQADEEQGDFDYDSVNIPPTKPLRSYEDASLQDEMSADADKAFEMAELESRMLSQEPNLGYFGANVKNQVFATRPYALEARLNMPLKRNLRGLVFTHLSFE